MKLYISKIKFVYISPYVISDRETILLNNIKNKNIS